MNGHLKEFVSRHLVTFIIFLFSIGVMWGIFQVKASDWDKTTETVRKHETKIELLEKDISYIKEGIDRLLRRK